MTHELEIVKYACLEAGKEILRYYKNSYSIMDKSYHNPVTDADHSANDKIESILRPEFPEYGWLSEETVDSPHRLQKDRVWIVDPLDGTKEFIEGVPNFVVSIGLVETGKPILGVLYNPVTEELFHAVKGRGSYYNGKRVRCSEANRLEGSSIVISRSETRRGLWKGTESWFSQQVHIGSVAYKLGLTATGKFDSFATLRPKNEWDVCAGDLLITEAGGVLKNLENGLVRVYNQKNPLITPGLIGGNEKLVNDFQRKWISAH